MAQKVYRTQFLLGARTQSSLGKSFNKTNKYLARTQRRAAALNRTMKTAAGALVGYFSIRAIANAANETVEAAKAQIDAETKLQTVLIQRTKATDEQVKSILNLTAAQQKLGIIGDEVQIAGAQQLSTFVSSTKSVETLIPAMNNLLAQQKGLNATQNDAVNIGNLMGKVLQGQTGALTRVGITFTKAQERVLKYGTEQQKAAMLAKVITDNVGEMNKSLADTDQGKVQQMTNMWGDYKEEIGKKILPLQARFAGWFSKKIPMVQSFTLNFIDKVTNGFGFISKTGIKAFNEIKKPVKALIKPAREIYTTYKNNVLSLFSNPILKKFGNDFIKNIMHMLPSFKTFVKTIISTYIKLLPIFKKVNLFIINNVLPLISDAFGFIANIVIPKVVNAFARWMPQIIVIVQKTWNFIQIILEYFINVVKFVFPLAKQIIMVAINTVINVVSGLIKTFGGVIDFLAGVFTGDWQKAWEGVKNIFGGIFESLVEIAKTPINTIIGLINGLIENINKVQIDVPDWIGKIPGVPDDIGGESLGFNIPKIPMLEKGGIAVGPTLAMIGEGKEKEAILPLSRLDALLNKTESTPNNSNPTIIFSPQITIQGNADESTINNAMNSSFEEFKRFMQRYQNENKRLNFARG